MKKKVTKDTQDRRITRRQMGGRKVELAALRGEIEALGGSDVIVRASRKTASRHVIAATDQVKAAGKGRLAFELTD